MRHRIVLMATVVTLGVGFQASRLRRPSPPAPPTVGAIYKVADNLYVVPGGGGNTAVFIAESGVVLVDTKYETSYQGMIEQVRTITDKPITHAVNTHFHGDHAEGNKYLPDGVEFVVQENTAQYLKKWNNVHGHPLQTFKDRRTLFSGKDAIDFYSFGPAHTDGDAIVVFREARVMHVGDLFPKKAPPGINLKWGGDRRTYADNLDKAIGAIKDVERVITGHGEVLTWADFVEFAEFNHLLLEHARSVVASGEDRHKAYLNWHVPKKFKGYELGRTELTLGAIYRGLESDIGLRMLISASPQPGSRGIAEPSVPDDALPPHDEAADK